jgi:hypothetical protein
VFTKYGNIYISKSEGKRGKILETQKKKISNRDMFRVGAAFLAAASPMGLLASPIEAGNIDEAYVRSLVVPGRSVLVIEYYDGQKSVVARRGYASVGGFQPVSPTDFKVGDKIRLHLFGLEPCGGEMVNRREGFAGSCDDFAKEQLAIKLKAARVLYCRAFVSEQGAAIQDATCFGYYHYPGTLDAIENVEKQLVSLGVLRLSKKADGAFLRPDLAAAEKIGRGGFGMWADPRVKKP